MEDEFGGFEDFEGDWLVQTENGYAVFSGAINLIPIKGAEAER